MFGSAKVTQADVMAANGIIHVIDAVVLPPADESNANTGTTANNAGATGTTTNNTSTVENTKTTVAGSMKVDITLPAGETLANFVQDENVKAGFQEGIAKNLGVDKSKVTVVLSVLSGRRLGSHSGGGNVKVDYTVEVAATESSDAVAAVKAKLTASNAADLGSDLLAKVNEKTGKTYAVEVKQVDAPSTSSGSTSTSAAPSTDAGAGRISCAPTVALLAMMGLAVLGIFM